MISLFVRSYEKDFEWLSYSVKSMRVNLLGSVTEKVLVVPINTEIPIDISSFFDKIAYTQETHKGYIAQQIDKIRAYKYCSNKYILFSDSDCIYYDPFDVNLWVNDGKCTLYKTLYDNIDDINCKAWRETTYVAVGIDSEYEYMRCVPLIHNIETLILLDNHKLFNQHISHQDILLSEFNALGVIAATELPHLYDIIEINERPLAPKLPKQYWSWGGFTDDIRKELEQI